MKYLPLLLTLFLSYFVQAQSEQSEENESRINNNSLVASGGDTFSSGGSVAYSVGQVFYNSFHTVDHAITEGVQQALSNKSEGEVPPVGEGTDPPSEENHPADPEIKIFAYPNPMTEFFIVNISNFKDEAYSYQLFDLHGRLVQIGFLEDSRTKVSSNNLRSAMYILKVFKQNENIKTFKIIKR